MQNRNNSLSQAMNRIFDLKGENTDLVAEFIQPVVPIINKCDIIKRGSLTNNTSNTIFTSAADKDTYITGIIHSYMADVTATSTYFGFSITVDGISTEIRTHARISLTVGSGTVSVTFANPIKLDRNTTVNLIASTNVANHFSVGTVFGYTQETLK